MSKVRVRGIKKRIEDAKVEYMEHLTEQKEIPWSINDGPQRMAAESEADELLFGGAAGGGKSALLLILATTEHRRSIIFRRVYPSLKEMIEKSRELLTGIGRYNSTDKLWRGIPGDRTLEFGAMEQESDKEKFRGRAHDLKAYDELTEFTQSQFEFTSGWCRTTIPGQRTRVIATCNPPSSQEGQWIIKRWAPWLDKGHPGYPELPGVLRWYVRDRETNEDVEVPSGDLIEYKGELLQPKSRTFIPAKLDDNPYLKDSNYRSTLQNLPEPLRSQLLYGDFSVSEKDHLWQVIPTQWVRDAQKRWSPRPQARFERLGVDISRGGKDETIIAPRYDFWIGELICHPGIEMVNGDIVANHVVAIRNNAACEVFIDVVAWGASPYDSLKRLGVPVHPMNAGEASLDEDGERKTDLTGVLGFVNQRSEWWWRMREWLDPANGYFPELPPDEKLLLDLTTPHWSPVPVSDPDSKIKGLIKVESKEDVKKRLQGRSTDRADAVIMTLADPPISTMDPFDWVRNI